MKKLLSGLLLSVTVSVSMLNLAQACEMHKTEAPVGQSVAAAMPTEEAAESVTEVKKEAAVQVRDGIRIEDVKVGEGLEAKRGDTISVNYLGTLTNGRKFDSSYDRLQPFVFTLGKGQVIEGWDKGLVGMKVGGKRILTIPSEKAYGEDGAPPVIPPNATLKFEVELVGVQ